MKAHWDTFFASVLCIVVLPLLPLPMEFVARNTIELASVMITFSVYAVTIGFLSRSPSIFAIDLLVGVLLAVAYGTATTPAYEPSRGVIALTIILAVFVSLAQILERYQRHVKERAPFFEFKD